MPMPLHFPKAAFWDDKKEEYIYTKETTIVVEHSLVSLSRWESKWKKAFLTKKDKSVGELADYVRCMTITQNVDPLIYMSMTTEMIDSIVKYIDDPMTATHFSRMVDEQPTRSEVVTSELIYYWMVKFGIPFNPCQKWHLNRLLALIETCSRKEGGNPKKMDASFLTARSKLNADRRSRLKSKG